LKTEIWRINQNLGRNTLASLNVLWIRALQNCR